MDYGKGALVFTTFAIHIHSVTIAIGGGSIWGGVNNKGHHNDNRDRDDAIKAFFVIAFLLYLVAFLLQVIMKTGEDLKVSNKIIGIILFILLIIGVVAAVIALVLWGDVVEEHIAPYTTTTYVVAAACAIIAAVFIMLSAVCGK